MTLKNHFRIYTGPTLVHAVANILSRHYIAVVLEGTEHVYVRTNFDRDHLLRVLGSTWRERDILRLPS